MNSAQAYPATSGGWSAWSQRRRVIIPVVAVAAMSLLLVIQNSQSAWADQLRASGGKWVGSRSLTMNASMAALPEVSRTRSRNAMDKPLTDQELAEQYEQQLAAGVEERRALRLRLKQVQSELAATSEALANQTSSEQEVATLKRSLTAVQQKLAAAQQEAQQLSKQGSAAGGKLPAPGASAEQTGGAYYRQYILQDLEPWAEHGITEDLVEEIASPKYEDCWYSNLTYEHSGFRFQIINGTLWVDHLPWHNYEKGVPWNALSPDSYNEKKGWTASGKARVPLMLVGLMDVLHAFPGQIPDLDAVLSVADFPCVPMHEEGRDKPPAPMMSFGAKPGTASILIPDHTHWGNEGPLLGKVTNGLGIQGWDNQYQHIKVAAHQPFLSKKNYAYWVGRVAYWDVHERDRQRYVLLECGRQLRRDGDPRAGLLSINDNGGVVMTEYCAHRYLPYLESHAYSSKYKQLLACGSVMVAPRIDYPDFFLRALRPGIHYVQLNSSDLCEDTASKLKEMDDVVWEHAHSQLNMSSILEPLFKQKRTSKTLRGPRFLDALEHGASIPNEPPPDMTKQPEYSWGSYLMPWEIAWNGQRWVEEHLTMQDVREGFRDVLIEYGKLMKYKPKPSKGAWCYDGPMVLRQFGPRPADGADILESHPWLLDYNMDQCADHITGHEKWPGNYDAK